PCAQGETLCGMGGMDCVDTTNDVAHCGACDMPCTGNDTCVDSMCTLVWAMGELDCGGNCVDPLDDPMFCGASGNCMGPNDGESCGVDTPKGDVCKTGVCIGERILIVNGDFSQGFNSWTAINSGMGQDLQTVFLPQSMQAFAPYQQGPSAHALYQDFTVPTNVSQASLTFSLFLTQLEPYNPQGSQQLIVGPMEGLRVDIVDPNGTVFMSPVVHELFLPMQGTGPIPNQLVGIPTDSAALLAFLQQNEGMTFRLRYGVVASNFPFTTIVDDVKFTVTGH
ncbi:MAG: hypothetical protein VB934_06225, partial [Polyangiaceae bacterium]